VRVLLTTILVRSGLMTHVVDLATHLESFGVGVCVGVPVVGNIDNDRSLLTPVAARPIRYYENPLQLAAFVREQGIDLIHAHSPRTFITAYEVAHYLRRPLVITLHSVKDWLALYPAPLGCASRLIAVGQAQARSAGPRFLRKLDVIQNGVDVDRFRPADLESGTTGPLRVLWFGRHDRSNAGGLQALDQAIQALRVTGRDIEARRVGYTAGSTAKALEVCGWSDDPVAHLQWGQVAFGHGRSLREAMACGNVGFLLAHGYGGRVGPRWFTEAGYTMDAFAEYAFPDPDPKTLARDLGALNDDRALLARLRREARETAEKVFDVKVMAGLTAQVYSAALVGFEGRSEPFVRVPPARGGAVQCVRVHQ
jgi:glycosyltransferase involved in cell wall biosynthesis